MPFVLLLAAVAAQGADTAALFDQKVKPLLVHHCYDCHSAKSKELKGNLKLDSLDGIMKGGANGPAVVAGDVENSFLLRAIRYQEADYQMPPSGRLSDEEIAGFERVRRQDPRATEKKIAALHQPPPTSQGCTTGLPAAAGWT
jgi:hypothetical protein